MRSCKHRPRSRLPRVVITALLLAGCPGGGERAGGPTVSDLMKARGLSEDDVIAALKTYTPTGKKDEYYMFASGGHGGQVLVLGLPSMRILKYIAVFTPEPWQGYGYGDQTGDILKGGARDGKTVSWGDTHHPGLSETNGDYDGQFLFIGDKGNGRVAVVRLTDFMTTQIVTSNLIQSDHGGPFVTPNTDYVVETSQYPAPLGGGYADISRYNDEYRGAMIFWRFDRRRGRVSPEESFAIELPPYMQDIADAGKLDSDGWAFCNSFNTERATGGNLEGQPSLESGASRNDMDYLHVVNWRRGAEVAQQEGKTETIAGMRVIRLKTAIDEGLIYFVPEPKSPHGIDVAPDGKDIVISGKLDTHATVYSWERIRSLIDAKKFEGRDPYGVPILPYREAIRGQCEVGLGPLHTQFDERGNAYTSLFIESRVARWSLRDLKVIEKLPVHYNIGHLSIPGGDTVKPDGRYLVVMNKWSLDRFMGVGPLLPQNFQLVDVTGPSMKLLYDLPIAMAEPHYAQVLRADRIHPIDVYTPPGINPELNAKDPDAVEGGKERIERRPDGVHVYMTAIRSHFTPDTIRVKQGETVHIHITNVEQAKDATHGFGISAYNISSSIEPGKHVNITFVADRAGVFPLYCTEFCSALHLEMAGYLLVEPAAGAGAP